jgi:hypothetical protein
MRAYFVTTDDFEGTGVVAIANTSKEARIMVSKTSYSENCESFIDIKPRWIRNANIEGLSPGVLEDWEEGLKRGFYSFIAGDCPECKASPVDQIMYDNGKFSCEICRRHQIA